MNWLMIKNDFKRNKMINVLLLLFVMLSASLAILSVLIGGETVTSISEMYRIAEPPHFLQMHKGELNQNEIDMFMTADDDVTDWQTQKMLNIYGENITINSNGHTYDLSDNRLDIGLIKQNEAKDLLLNQQHERVQLEEGQIGMPKLLRDRYALQVGDEVILHNDEIEKKFTISDIVLDAQMNSPLVSSTRILVSDVDYETLENVIGEAEYIIEAYFTDKALAADFQSKYEQAGLPRNGPAITYTMMFLLSALTDLIVVFLLIMISALLILISFICVRFTMMAALEEEVYEIGTMKAIGLPYVDIRAIYLNKYRVLTAGGVILGYLFAILTSNIFTQHIHETFGNSTSTPIIWLLAIVVAFIVYITVILYCKKVLKKIKSLTVVKALTTGTVFGQNKQGVKDGLHQTKAFDINWTLAIRELVFDVKKWVVVFTVVLMATMIILTPINILNTFEAPEFITYMGGYTEDLLIQIESGDQLEKNYVKVKDILETSDELSTYHEYRRVNILTRDIEGRSSNLHIDIGLNSGNGLQYLEGQAPVAENEIALSYLNADKLMKEIGDEILLIFNDHEEKFILSGIYQDVTSGGFTAKTVRDFPELESYLYTFSVDLKDDANASEVADAWENSIGGGVSVDPMTEFLLQTVGGLIDQLQGIVVGIAFIGLGVVLLIAVLFLKLRLTRDLPNIAILKAVGFSNKDIKLQYMIKMGVVATAGVVVGILLTSLLNEQVINLALSLSGLGLKEVNLTINPLIQYVLCPFIIVALILIATRTVYRSVEKYDLLTVINE